MVPGSFITERLSMWSSGIFRLTDKEGVMNPTTLRFKAAQNTIVYI